MSLATVLDLARSAGSWVYVLLGGLAFGEAAIMIGMALPGETALLVGGYLAHEQVLSLPVMITVAVLCAIAGDSVGYYVGRSMGPGLRRSRVGRRIGEARWDRAELFLHRRGGPAVLIGRATAFLRAVVPGLAGAGRMPYLRVFMPWNITGGVAWGAGCVLVGYVFAASIDKVAEVLRTGSAVLVAATVVLMVGLAIVRRLRERRAAVQTAQRAELIATADMSHDPPSQQ
jgi:membrane protein DedA with SNARE-associated domain